MAKTLLTFGADLNIQNDVQKTALHYAVKWENIQVDTLTFLKKGPNWNSR